MIDKKTLSERDICTKYVTPALIATGWDLHSQISEDVRLTDGRVIVRGQTFARGEFKRADYLLYHKPNIPIAVIEAKDNNHSVGAGMQQALRYAEMLDLPFVYSTNGDAFLQHDKTAAGGVVEREIALDAFPSPDDLWQRYQAFKQYDPSKLPLLTQAYHLDRSGKTPRYYQIVAINRAIEAISKEQKRILMVMATGTGKTFTAFQIIWRLWRSRSMSRILFLADRNILVDQAVTNDFKPFGSAMTKIRRRQADKSYEIYTALYQAISGNEEERNIYKQFSPDFFDLVVVDECHRGSAAEDSAWREILEYFSSATQIGLTATPKETKDVSNIDYFGDPIYTYSLRQGIEDGFLAPYKRDKVIRIDLDKDVDGWRPTSGQRDKHDRVIEDRIYNQTDFDRTLVLEKRSERVAQKITEFLKATDRFTKTILFCEDIDHAERMRQLLANENADLVAENHRYVMRITGDTYEGKAELDNFIDPESEYPVVVTTSRLLDTGVDAQTCKLIVLDQTIHSMTRFKQIIGRGTRINEEHRKFYFTIMDFRKATELFADPDFDGDPVQIYEPDEDDSITQTGDDETDTDGDETDESEKKEKRFKYVVDNVPVEIIAERVQYYGKDGGLVTESLRDYTRKTVQEEYESLDTFLRRWNAEDRKGIIIKALAEQGVLFEPLAEQVGKDFDPFDLICHVVFDQPLLTRRERADNVRKRDYFTKYGELARATLNALLDKYADEGVDNIEDMMILKLPPFTEVGTPIEIVKSFGGKGKYWLAIHELQQELYKVA